MKKIAILGASYLQLPLVEKANQMGIETHCFAWDNADAVCKNHVSFFYPISVLEKEAILEKCLEIGIDGITTIATDICVPTISFVATEMGLVGNSVDCSIAATNKAIMRERFAQHQVNSPKFFALDSKMEIPDDVRFPLIVKPTDRSGSRGVHKVADKAELDAALQESIAESLEHKAIVEEFIEGVEVSVETISWQGQHYILAITDKVTSGAPHFVELQHHQPSQLSAEIQDIIKEQTIKALNSLDIKFGASHPEFKITKEGKVVAIEVGARMGGDFIGSHLVMLSTGYDFLKGVIDVALNQFATPEITQHNYSGVYFLSKESEYLLPYFNSENTFDIQKQILKNELSTITNSNDRSGYIIYQANQKINLQ